MAVAWIVLMKKPASLAVWPSDDTCPLGGGASRGITAPVHSWSSSGLLSSVPSIAPISDPNLFRPTSFASFRCCGWRAARWDGYSS